MNARGVCRIVVGVGALSMVGLGAGLAQTKASIVTAKESLAVGNKRYDAEKELPRMTKRYGLTDDQKAKIGPLLLEQQKQVHALGEDESLSNAEWSGEVRKVHLQTVAKVKALLTDEQLSKYAKDEAKSVKDSKDGEEDGPFGPPPGGGPGGFGPPPGV